MRAELPSSVLVFERGWLSANNILLTGRDEVALVDSGYCTHAPQTLALVEGALGARSLDRLLNTHLHSDHCGGNAALQEKYSALRIQIPPGDAVYVANWDVDRLSFRATGQQCPRFNATCTLEPGTEEILGDLRWEVHSAPGHDPHSIILFEPVSRTLISADALWENGFGVVFPELVGEPSFDEVAATLDLIEHLAPDIVIPGHGEVFRDASGALATARRRLEGLSKSPEKHARHAFKVLIKFKLLELQVMTDENWQQWRDETPYLETIRRRFFASRTMKSFSNELLDELVTARTIDIRDGRILNI